MPHPYGNLETVIDLLGGNAAVTVESYGTVTFDDSIGYAVRTPGASTPTAAVVNPIDPAELDELDLEANDEAIELFTKQPLVVSDSNDGAESDRIVWNGRRYRVILVEDRRVQARIARAVAVRERN